MTCLPQNASLGELEYMQAFTQFFSSTFLTEAEKIVNGPAQFKTPNGMKLKNVSMDIKTTN